MKAFKFSEFIYENAKFPHQIKNEKYWRLIVGNDQFLNSVLDTIIYKQHKRASNRQIALLRRRERGDTTPYSSKN